MVVEISLNLRFDFEVLNYHLDTQVYYLNLNKISMFEKNIFTFITSSILIKTSVVVYIYSCQRIYIIQMT